MQKISAVLVALTALAACTHKPAVPMKAPDGPWVSLLNGKDLDGWTVKIAGHDVNDNYKNTFRVEQGVLKVAYDQYDNFGRQFGSLFYNKKLSHYWIRAEYRFVGSQAPGAPSWAFKDSGIQLHSQPSESMLKDQEFPVSVEFNLIGGRTFGNRPTGDVCENETVVKVGGTLLKAQCSNASDITIRDESWVTVEAEVQGATAVRQIVNGQLIVEYTDLALDPTKPNARRLLDGGAKPSLSEGYISIQSNSHPVEFRKIEVLPMDSEELK